MSARHLCWLLDALLVLAGLALIVAAAFVVVSPLIDQALVHSWDVRTTASLPGPALQGSAVVEPSLRLDRAELTVAFDGGAGWLLKAADMLVLGALSLAVLWWLRAFAVDMRNGQPFSAGSARRLRRIGLLLIAVPIWQAVSGALWQQWLFTHVTMADPASALLPSIAGTPAGIEAWQLMLDIDVGYAVSGLIWLVIAQAFHAGIALRHENEEIV